jgi:hypothetical protein
MLTNNRLFYLWCVLTVGIVLISILPGSSGIYHFLAAYDSNRWAHFLEYAALAAIPVAAWKRKASMLFSLILAIVCIALELRQTYIPGSMIHGKNVPADLFGIAAGVLLALNIRVMRNSAKSFDNLHADSSHSRMY